LALVAHNVLSKIGSAAFVLPVFKVIGQLKWTWFRGSELEEMIGFEIVEKAP
jgi:hypothetical protein